MDLSRTKRRALRRAAAIAAVLPAVTLVACSSVGGGATAAATQRGYQVPASHHTTARAAPGQQTSSGRTAVRAATVTSPAHSAGTGPGSGIARSLAPAAAGLPGSHQVTFVNQVSQTIWVAASQDPAHRLATTGWVLRPGQRVTITVPSHWNGRFWGRTGCVFNHGLGHCQTGDCAGHFQCTGYGGIPATLAEYDMNAWDGLDFYDVSMVDGSNLPMYITLTSGQATNKVGPRGCVPAGCTKPVVCPSVLQVKVGAAVVGCESACARLGTDQYCCRAAWAPRSQCVPARWPVDYAAVFKRAEPYAYSFSGDDATSMYVCKGRCNYRITFGITPRK
jgi:hypothetical protein